MVKPEAFRSFASAFGMMERISSDAEDGLSSSQDEGEQNAENFVLCSFAHHAGSPFLPGFLHEEEL